MTLPQILKGRLNGLKKFFNRMDRKKIDSFWKKRALVKHRRISTHFREDDSHVFDLQLIEQYINPSTHLLDLGCGTCYITNQLADKVSFIKGVDKFKEFLSACETSEHFKTEQVDVLHYRDNKQYDVILLFGVMVYFDENESRKIYANCKAMLKKGGTLIVKHQTGNTEDIVIDAFSKQIGDHYYAVYKHIDKDVTLLKEFFDVNVIDIYPPKLNPWPNTHFYAFVCSHKQ